jgi:DNA-binding MarR family transcriptional regulator
LLTLPVEPPSAGSFMNDSIFNPEQQQQDLSSKIVAGLERISEVFKILIWEKAKIVGLSPIQIQLLLFIAFHKQEMCSVSHLAKEFNVTKPTISDAIRMLHKKELIIKDYSSPDSRSYTILLSQRGRQMVSETGDFAAPLKNKLTNFEQSELESLFATVSQLIYKLNHNGILTIQRMCFACTFYERQSSHDYCNLLKKPLANNDIRLDCPEFKENV